MTRFPDQPNARAIVQTLSARAAEVQAGAAPVPSPCVSVCCINHSTGWCEGCLRSLDDIMRWSHIDDGAKRVIWQRLTPRIAAWQAQMDADDHPGAA